MAYRFNNGRGAVTCDLCRIIYDEKLSHAEYMDIYGDVMNFCPKCKERYGSTELAAPARGNAHKDDATKPAQPAGTGDGCREDVPSERFNAPHELKTLSDLSKIRRFIMAHGGKRI